MWMFRYFTGAFVLTGLGLAAGAALGWNASGTMAGTLSIVLIVTVLCVLEISLSFDNAIVNATILKDMEPRWQRRFLTWGIAIAVFGMRIVFPLLIVAIAARLGPIEAVTLAVLEPDRYARILTDAHTGIAAFGGMFLLMVGIKYFLDAEKEVHWVDLVERHLVKFASLEAIEIVVALMLLYGFSRLLPAEETLTFLTAGIFGLVTFIAVHALGGFMAVPEARMQAVHRAGFASFLYLELLDASFSFDGVIGAFALSNNLFVIAIGLGVGAMYVRSMTVMLVERGTLAEYRYLEHGAFWAILALALIMLTQTVQHIPEVVTGLIGVALIGAALVSSVRHNRRSSAGGGQISGLAQKPL